MSADLLWHRATLARARHWFPAATGWLVICDGRRMFAVSEQGHRFRVECAPLVRT